MRDQQNVVMSQCHGDCSKRGVSWAWFAFFAQIPFVFWYAQGSPALHPIVVMLPLVGLLNFKVENRDRSGLGLRLVKPGSSVLLALVYASLSILGGLIALRLWGFPLQIRTLTAEMAWELVLSFIVGVFIIALWEELLNRGYIQTRLQEAWGFWAVIVTTLLFAAMHIPSALLDFENDILQATIRFFEAGLAGFALGYIYWRTRSVVTTIAVHGLNNFAVSGILPLLTGISAPQVLFKQSAFQLAWLIGQVGVTIFIAKALFKSSEQFDTEA